MGIILGILMFIFVCVCLGMIFIILLQSSKGDSLASGIFGGGGMQNLFGGRGAATFLSKLTTGLAIAFIVLSVILAKFYGTGGSAPKIEKEKSAETQIVEDTESTEESAMTQEETPENVETQESEQTNSEKDNTQPNSE